MAYRQASAFVSQFLDANGEPLAGGTIKAYLAGTTTTTSLFTDDSGTSAGSTITLNARGEPEVSGNTINIWLDETITYKLILADSAGATIWTVDNINVGIAAAAAEILSLAIDSLDVNDALAILTASVQTLDTSGALETLSDAVTALTITGGLQNALDAKLNTGDNAVSASKWQTARSLTLNGGANGTVTGIDGTTDITINTTIADDSHNHTISNVDGLQAALDGKLGTGSNAVSASNAENADKLDGYHAESTRDTPNTIPVRDANGYLHLGWINTTSGNTNSTINRIYASYDDNIRYITPDTLKSQLGLWHTGNDGAGSGLDADTVDGLQASSFLRSDTADTKAGNLTIAGNLTVDNNNNTTVDIISDDGGMSELRLYGNTQGTGRLFVGQSTSYGGGIEYNGDDSPSTTGAGIDYIALYRRDQSQDEWTAKNYATNNDWYFRGNVTAYASDQRLKENITTINNALDKVTMLRGVTFDWKEDCKDKGFLPSAKHETGVIAQEVQKVIPDAVVPAPFDEKYLTVKHEKIIPVLIQAIKELNAKVDQLEGARQ